MSLLTEVLATMVFLLDLALLGGLVVFAGRKLGRDMQFLNPFERYLSKYSYHLVLLTASIATAGSLYLSNFLGWSPCRLCWFQRIFMYPIVLLSGAAIYLDKDDLEDYVIPLALVGIPIAFYHAVIQRFDQFTSAGCSVTQVSCETQYTFHYAYITIPVMALTAFLVVSVILWRYD